MWQLSSCFFGFLACTRTQVFDDRFQDPRRTSEDRFLWDFFHIPNQYTMHRTQVRTTQLLLPHSHTATQRHWRRKWRLRAHSCRLETDCSLARCCITCRRVPTSQMN